MKTMYNHRLYYMYMNENKKGKWWYQDFANMKELKMFLEKMKKYFRAWSISKNLIKFKEKSNVEPQVNDHINWEKF